ncbi:putative secreted protein with PEP-CTERM sorting signal [Aliiruegeria haliotis]|uniref:Putative secreted protein with PEP-CTERM sorting signal n=1 Tax=Aliiruegeria haliotis TaxID=1280846 RepID=A0A2T0RYM4_9RHOB|nr:hypothetical protein [Aliiruegeria haliotis]PRY26133.1 putative secreted protein with PEP-CTERM sorting signal [Aliiruegeria haliotis]
MRHVREIAAAMALTIAAGTADASVVGALGNGVGLGSSAGQDFQIGITEDTRVQGWDEAQNVTVASNSVRVDYLLGSNFAHGDSLTGLSTVSPTPQYLPAGTYASDLIRYDPVGAAGSTSGATFTFGGEIIGIIVSNYGSAQLLAASDSVFGLAVAFDTFVPASLPAGTGRRSEDEDRFSVAASGTRITIGAMGARGGHIDEIRVITAAPAPVPVPGAGLLLLGAIGILAARRRKA